MTDTEFIDRAIDVAVAGTDHDKNVITRQTQLLMTLKQNALHKYAEFRAAAPDKRHLVSKTGSVVLTSGEGTFPADALSACAGQSTIRDENGNVLLFVREKMDFLSGSLSRLFGYYHLLYATASTITIQTRQISSGDLTATIGPLSLEYVFVPTATQIAVEDEDDAVAIFATLIKAGIEKFTPVPL